MTNGTPSVHEAARGGPSVGPRETLVGANALSPKLETNALLRAVVQHYRQALATYLVIAGPMTLLGAVWSVRDAYHPGASTSVDRALDFSAMVFNCLAEVAIAARILDPTLGLGAALSLATRRLATAIGVTFLGNVIVGIGTLALVVPGCMFFAASCLAMTVVAVEPLGSWASIERSWRLTKGNRRPLFAAYSAVWGVPLIALGFVMVVGSVALAVRDASDTAFAAIFGPAFMAAFALVLPAVYVVAPAAYRVLVPSPSSARDLADVFA